VGTAEPLEYHDCSDPWAPQGPTITLNNSEIVDSVIHDWEMHEYATSWNPLKRIYAAADKNLTKKVEPAINYAKEKVEVVTDSVKSASEEVVKVGQKISGVVDQLKQFIADIPTHLPGADTIMSICVGAISVFTVWNATDSVAARLATVGLFLARFIDVSSVLEWAVDFIRDLLPCMTEFVDYLLGKLPKWRPQGPADSVLKVTAGLVSLIVAILLKRIPQKQDFDSVLRRIDLFPKAIKGAGDLYSYVTAALRSAFEICCKSLGLKSPLHSGLPTEVDDWVKEANAILTEKLTEVTYTSAYSDRVMNCYVKGTVVIKNLNSTRSDPAIVRYVATIHSAISSLNTKLAHLGFTSGPRAEPLMVYLHGTSGKGKSGLTVPFFIELARHDPDFDPKDWSKLIYMRCAENEYWDGARNDQPFLCYDDFAQQRDSAANPNPELFEIIRLANIVPYPAHMASLEEKGKTFLHPRCVLLTSNSAKPMIQSLTFTDAFFRRMDITAEVDVKPEFLKDATGSNGAIKMLDTSKCKGKFDPNVYLFRTNKPDGTIETLDWVEFTSLVKFHYEKKLTSGAQLLKELNNYTQHSVEDIYDAMANGTFQAMVDASAKGTQWETQAEEDPYEPRTGRDYKDLHDLCVNEVNKWNSGLQSPSTHFLDVIKSLHRELVRFKDENALDEEQQKFFEYMDCEFYCAEMHIAAQLAEFYDDIDQATVVGQLYRLYLSGKLPAQLWPDRSSKEDFAIINYFNAQKNAAFNEYIWPDVCKEIRVYDESMQAFRDLTSEEEIRNAFFKGVDTANRYLYPATIAYQIHQVNMTDRDGSKFSLDAVARAYKCMYYGRFALDQVIDQEVNGLIELYTKRGAGVFNLTYKKVNHKAALRLGRVFVQCADNCSRIGCTQQQEVCYRRAIDAAIESGLLLQHEVDELNQKPIYIGKAEIELIDEIHGETFWERMRERYLKIHCDIISFFGTHTSLAYVYLILTGAASMVLMRTFISLLYMCVRVFYNKIIGLFVPKASMSPEGMLSSLAVAAGFKKYDIGKQCPLCANDVLFTAESAIDAYAKLWFTRAGFISRFQYYSILKMATEPHRFTVAQFRMASKKFDEIVGPGFFHACLHGKLNDTPIFAASSFDDDTVKVFEKNFAREWQKAFDEGKVSRQEVQANYLGIQPESFNLKDPKQQRVGVESFNLKDARAQRVKIESFNMKDPRAQRMKVEMEPEGNVKAEAYFDAMRQVYADAQVAPEGLVDGNAWDIISKKLWNNQAIMTTTSGSEICKGVFIKGNCFLTYKHWMNACNAEYVTMRFLDGREFFKFKLADAKVHERRNTLGENEDIMLLELPKICPQYPDITKYFVTKMDLPKVHSRKAQFCGIASVGSDQLASYSLQNLDLIPEDADYENSAGISFTNRSGYKYVGETKPGDCGSVLILRDTAFDKKILGMHVAGCAGFGFSVCVYYEKLLDLLKNVGWVAQCYPPTELIPTEDVELPKGAFMSIGKLPFGVGTCSGSTLRPTSISGCCIDTFTKPAYLHPINLLKDGETILWDPLMKGLEKCGTVIQPLPQELVNLISGDVARVYSNNTSRSRERRIYSLHEAVFGIEGDDYFKSLTASTSPGFPWGLTKQPRTAGKRTWLDLDALTISPDLEYHVDKRIEFALAGRRYPTLWMDLLKDERRPIEKVDQGKTRVFSGSPLDFTVACRMYFGAFVAAQAEGRIENESLVGTNCYAFDWNLIALKLKRHGDNIVAGDYSNWDGSVSAQLLFAALDVINTWYGDDVEGNMVREVLMMDIAFSMHVIGQSVYMWTHSMPSGVYLTATVNTVIGQMLMRLFYMSTAPRHMANMSSFEKNVSIVIYGDDNVVGISKEAKGFFNQQTITQAATDLGMTYTDEQKSGNVVPPTRSLTDVTLLKRHFVYSDEEGRWTGPLQLKTVLDVPNWYRNDNPEAVVLPLIVECTMRELALHDKQTYDTNRHRIVEALVSAHHRVPAIPSYAQLRFEVLNGFRSMTGKSIQEFSSD